MARDWGKINGNRLYGVITFDMDRAFALAGLREYEAIIVQVMREHSWGPARKKAKGEPWPDATPYNPPLYALAKSLGVPLPRLSEAKARLLASSILTPAGDGFLINKNADEWTDPTTGQPRLTDMQIAYALAAPKRSAPVTRKRNQCPSDQVTPNRNAPVTPERNQSDVQVTPERNQWLRQSVTIPTEKHARVLEFSEDFVCVNTPPTPKSNPEPEDWVALCERADAIFASEATSFPHQLRAQWGVNATVIDRWGDWPADAWRDALAALHAAGRSHWTVNYYIGIVRRIAAAMKAGTYAPSPNGAAAPKSKHDRRVEEMKRQAAERKARREAGEDTSAR